MAHETRWHLGVRVAVVTHLPPAWPSSGESPISPSLSPSLSHISRPPSLLEAFVSVMGMGDDINGIIRTCPPPRDGESELACQVRGFDVRRGP